MSETFTDGRFWVFSILTGTESEFSRSSAPSSKESKKTVKEKGGKEKGKGDEPVMDEGFKKGFKPDESSFLPEIKTGIDEYNFSHRFAAASLTHSLPTDTMKCGRERTSRRI